MHLREANEFVAQHHRHNLPTVGGKFAVGAPQDGNLVGVAIAGRPVASRLGNGKTLEVHRVATDGSPNACKFLCTRCARIVLLMGNTLKSAAPSHGRTSGEGDGSPGQDRPSERMGTLAGGPDECPGAQPA